MGYSTGCHTTFHHRYHIVWAPKYRFKVLHGEVRIRVHEIIRQVCGEMGVTIINVGTVRNFVRGAGYRHQMTNRSPKITANWVFAWDHSRGGRFHSWAALLSTRYSSFIAASSPGK